jgi:hypothetical protein
VWTLSFINSAASVQLFDANERPHFIINVNGDFERFAQYDWEAMSSAASTSIHPIFDLTVALIRNADIIMARTKAWTVLGITTDCPVLHFVLQRKPPRRDVCEFFCVKRKLFRLASALHLTSDSHFTCANQPNIFPFMSSMRVRVFA